MKTTPKDFFMHLLVFAALYASVVSFLILIFAYVDVTFPDRLEYFDNSITEIITPSSILIVIFPVFILASWLLGKDLSRDLEKREMKFRKWLVYFTLFVAAITIVIDLISLVSSFYHGELTTRFLLKILATLIVTAGVFWFYFWNLKHTVGTLSQRKVNVGIGTISSVLVLAAIVGGFFIVGTPAEQRARRFDDRRVSDLQVIQNQLVSYWIQKEKLPEKTDDLAYDLLSGFIVPRDPETDEAYQYEKLTTFSFKLCTIFKTENNNESLYPGYYGYPKPAFLTPPMRLIPDQFNLWSHGQGHICFERTIDPELYKKSE